MAVQNDTSRIQYNGNNSTVNAYAIPFPFFENGHIRAVVTNSAGVDTELALGSGFTLTGAGNPSGGSLVTVAAVPATSKVTIFRSVPATQTTSYQEGGDFPAASHERALDKLTMIAQQTKRLADRALKVPESQSTNPPDLPNAGSGSKVLSSSNASLQWIEERQLPPYPTAPIQKLLTAPGSGVAPSWQDAPTIAVGPITSTGSNTPRFIADRFNERVNVLDLGADPTGATDSWLAIQRAIALAANHPVFHVNAASLNVPANTETTLTTSDTDCIQWFNKVWPKLFFVTGGKQVYFPVGTYRISRPIVVGPGTHLVGEAIRSLIVPMSGLRGQFNMIESNFVWMSRTQCDDNTPFQAFAGFDAEFRIEGIQCSGFAGGEGYSGGTTPQLAFYRLPLMESGPGSTYSVKGTGTIGSGSFTLSGNHQFFPGCKIKFTGHNTVYTYVSRSGTTINVTPNLTASFTNQNVLLGLPANNGLMINGGENAFVRHCLFDLFSGAGIFVCKGTPAPLVENTMCNSNDIGFWMDSGTNTLVQPSGDGNNVFLRTGYLGLSKTTMISCKVEGQRLPGLRPDGLSDAWPYPMGTSNRSAIEFGSWTGAGPAHLNIIGGSVNMGYGVFLDAAHADTHAFIEAWRDSGEFNRLHLTGCKQLGYRNTFYRQINAHTGTVDVEYKRRKGDDFEDHVDIGSQTTLGWYDDTVFPHAIGTKFLTRFSGNNGGSYGLFGDQGSGVMPNSASYTRSGTTATFTYYASDGVTPAAHGLQPGDVVFVRYPASFNNANRLNPDTSGGNGYFSGAMIVKTVGVVNGVTAEFTTTVLNSGGTAGADVILLACKIFYLHAIENGEHYLQMPQNTGGTTGRALTVRDKQGRAQVGLRVPTADEGAWWVKKELMLGGTMEFPDIRVWFGAGAPSASLPDGSLYLRTDGTADTTLYVRAAGAWAALTTT
jgi:hypothetical protein